MAFSVSWDSHMKNVCQGLSSLQQNGEFVDMTLAADGHLVKVHQVVMALASPYIKELIASANCPHPVIFLNQISYVTLSSILEYIYTGEVHVSKDCLNELIVAAKGLHIRGLEDMKVEVASEDRAIIQNRAGQPLMETRYYKNTRKKVTSNLSEQVQDSIDLGPGEYYICGNSKEIMEEDSYFQSDQDDDETCMNIKTTSKDSKAPSSQIQYTVTNQGTLQMILNRFLYYLRYTSRKGPHGHRMWRCINYTRETTKCPASVITQDEVVVKRIGVHNHPFHDKKILRKVQDNSVFSAINEAEDRSKNAKNEKQRRNTKRVTDIDTTDAE